jgi:uncharacterized protein (DUF305 family)
MKRGFVFSALLAVTLLSGCGQSSTSETADFNDADVMFAQMMIPHHEQAIEMSEIALDPASGASAAIQDLAIRIRDAQDPEIEMMKGFLATWGAPLNPEDGMDHSSMMEGMLTVEELDELAGLQGSEFDVRWAQAMIAHHKGAVAMAEDVLSDGKNPETRKLAEEIIANQQAEIDELTPLSIP